MTITSNCEPPATFYPGRGYGFSAIKMEDRLVLQDSRDPVIRATVPDMITPPPGPRSGSNGCG